MNNKISTRISEFIFLLAIFLPAVSHGNSAVTYTYSELGQVATINGPRTDVNDVATFSYYANGDLSAAENALGHVIQYFDYDLHGNPGRIIDSNGMETLLTYDSRGRLLGKRHIDPENTALGSQTTYSYDETGLLTKVVLPNGGELDYHYDGFARLISVSNSVEEKVEYSRDSAGNIIGQMLKSSGGQISFHVSYVYDELRQLRSVINATSDTMSHEYDLLGNITATTDGRDNTTGSIYDELDRLTKLIDPAQYETQIGYDSKGNLSTVTDANGNTTTYSYDAFGNLTSQSSPDTGVTTHQYDSAHNRTRTMDSRGVVTEYKYDALNRLVEVIYPASSIENIIYSYDDTSNGNYGVGRLTEISSSTKNIEYIYNFLGLVTEKRNTLNNDTAIIQYDYDLAGQLTKITYPSDRQVRYEYDALGRIAQVFTRNDSISPEVPVVSGLTYLPFGPVKELAFGNGLNHTLSYDQNYRLTGIQVDGINPLLDRQYQYDGANNITAIVNGVDVLKSQSFAYDPLDRLINADGQYGLIDYTYDPVGNRLSQRIQSNGDDIEENYIYANDSNQLLYLDKNTNGIPSQSREFSYDAVGNRIEGHGENGSTHDYQYNAANRLTGVSVDEDPAVTYTYNPLGQRIQKLNADGSEERYHYNESGQLLSVTDENGATLREYIYRGTQQIALIARTEGQTFANPTAPPEPAPILVLDESTVNFLGNHTIDTNVSGWTGTGFIDYIGEGHAEWSINIPSEGTYNVRVRYSLSSGTRRLKIVVDGVPGVTMNFPVTGSFSDWTTASEIVVLPAGNITFALETTGSSGANIDKIELQEVEPLDLIVLDEGTATFEGSHEVASNLGGYHNAGFIDVVGEGQINWPLSVDVDTTFSMNIRYSLGAPSRPMQVLLNGVEVGYAGFQPTTGFAVWEFFNLDVTVPAGNNILSLKTLGSSGPNIDQMELTPTSTSGSPVDPVPLGELALYYIHDDHLGAPQVVTNAQQQVVWMADYLPFGQMMPNANNEVELYSRFPGQYLDEETGLHYNYFRDYDPSIGRYIQSDPIGMKGGINSYSYVNQNPLRYADPLGLHPAAAGLCFVPGFGWVGCGAAAIGIGGAGLLCHITGACKKFADACGNLWGAMNESSDVEGEDEGGGNQRGNPPAGEPGEWVEHPHGKQDRLYDNDGKPAVDIDYGHDHGQGTPHAHNWKDGVRDTGVPVSILDN